jgi:hypothetical protein
MARLKGEDDWLASVHDRLASLTERCVAIRKEYLDSFGTVPVVTDEYYKWLDTYCGIRELEMGVKPTQKPKFGSSECISHLIWGKLETLCKNCDACNH